MILKFMKYFSIFMMLFCGAATGLCIAHGNYGLALLNGLCVFLNFNSYKNLVTRELEQQ